MDTTRRQFVTWLGASATLAATTSSTASTATSAASANSSIETANRSIRDEFDFTNSHIPMNAANLCPSPRRVSEAVTGYTQLIDVDPSFQNRARFADLLEVSRAAVAAQLNVSPDELALVRNTSEANNIVNNGLDLEPGDEVVIWEQNHPTNNVAWDVRARRFGLVVQRVSVPVRPESSEALSSEALSSEALVGPFRQAITPRTKVLSVTHVSNVSGLRLPLEELADLCRTRGIHFHVDGAQTWGALNVDLKAVGCDSFSASAHKWFMGPKEVGLLYVRDDAIERIWPASVAPGWGDDADTDLIGARKFESLGQRDDAALAAVATAAALHEGIGPANVEAQMTHLAQRLKQGLVESGATLVSPMAPEFSGGVCIVSVAPDNRVELFDRLYREHGIIGAPTGGLRLCPHVYNTDEHVDRAIAGVGELRHLLS